MNQPAQGVDMRSTMPDTADWVARKRLDWGKDHVNNCLRRATVGKEPGYFYALERGRVVGTPFPADHPAADAQRYAVLHGCTFAVFMLEPGAVQASGSGSSA